MKRKYNKAITTLTIIVMLVTMLLPMGANAAPGTAPALVSNPSGGTFTEADKNDGTVNDTIPVDLDWEYYSDNVSSIKSQLPSGLNLTTAKDGTDVKVTISGTANDHAYEDSVSITITFRTRKLNWLSYNYKDEPKTFNIIFNDPPAAVAGFERGPIRVLEVYPSKLTNDQVSGTNDPSKPAPELYNLLNGKSDSNYSYLVTSMSMNKFISLRDEINGSYDIVYFGKGTYCRNSVDATYFGNDITELRAGKVLSFINSNQLCIFHADVFKGVTEDGTKDKDPVTIIANQFKGVKNRANVKIVNSADEAKSKISAEYKNFNHRPILNVTDCPPSYLEGLEANHNLAFEYGVYDPDLLDENATLTVELYIDRNCNSLFEETERVATRKIINGEYDTVLFDMPVDYTGIFFWKLVVTDTTMSEDGTIPLGAKAEKVDVFHVKGEEITINVLQIKPNADNNASLTELFGKPASGGKDGDTLGHRQGEFNIIVTEATVDEFNNGLASKHLRDLNTYYDMVILGFADNYSDDREFNAAAIAELQEFINSKQSVMFTHDSIHFKYNTNLTNAFNDDVGQSERGGRGETAGLLGFSGSDPAGNKLESNLHSEYNDLNNKYKLANYQTVNPYPDTANLVRPVNSNTITLYPYNLEKVAQNERKVANTHYQWFKLDLEDETVIPLFNLYKDKSGERVNDDSMNNYYTYTKGSITYSGTGHKNGYPDYEIKLFINTAIKAHAVANKKPIIELVQPSENTVNITTPTIPLSFRLHDDYDTQLKYWIDVDYDNNGSFERTIASDVTAATDVLIDSNVLENRSSVGKFSIRIRAKEPRPDGAESVLIKEIECVNVPVFKPKVTFTDMDDNAITACLIGETVNINTNITASGNIAAGQNKIKPKYDLEAKYLDGTSVVSKANLNVDEFTFYPAAVPTPVLGYTYPETVTLTPSAATQLKVSAKAKYDAFEPQEGTGTLIVNNGSVKIQVTDGVRKLKDVYISDGDTPLARTGNTGTLTLNKVTGDHQYKIKDEDIPEGYKLTPGSVTVTRMSDNHTTTSDSVALVELTGENYYWEVTFKLTLDLGIHTKYYKMKSSAGNWTASYLGADGGSYYLRCPKGLPARYLTRIEIDTIGALKVHGIKFELETLDKNGNPVAPANAAVIVDDPVALAGPVPAELNPLNVKQLKADNGVAGVPADGTYAGKSYYLVVHMPSADLQKVRIKKVTLTFEDSSEAYYVPSSDIIFGEPATPLLK